MAQQPKKRNRKRKKKLKYIDVILAVVILVSAGVIMRSIHFRKKEAAIAGKLIGRPSAAVVPTNRVRRMGALEESKHIDDVKWAALKAGLSKKAVTESLGCARKAPAASALYFFDFDVEPRIKQGKFRNAWIFTANDCYRVGSKILLIGGAQSPTEPYVRILGEVEVTDLIRGPVREFPESVFQELGLKRERLETFDFVHPQYGSVFTLLRFSPTSAAFSTPLDPPLQFPATRVLTGEDAKNAIHSPEATLVDVRSVEEFRQRALPKSINIPFGSAPEAFSWTQNAGKVQKTKFEFGPLLVKKTETLIVYGSDRADGRSFWALAELYQAGFRKLIWLPEGISKLN